MASLCNDTLLRNSYVAFEIALSEYFLNKDFLFPHSLVFTERATVILHDKLYWKILVRCQGRLRQ